MRLHIRQSLILILICVLSAIPFSLGSAEEGKAKEDSIHNARGAIVSTAEYGSSRCVVCGDFLYKHNNPDFHKFQCVPMANANRGVPESRRFVCPICNNVHEADFVRQLDFSGGIDSDFCFHSTKASDYLTNIHTCINCGYTALVDGFYEMPSAKTVVDDELKRTIDRQFELLPSYIEWVKKELTKSLHDKLTLLAQQIYKQGDWTLIQKQDTIPIDIKLDYLIRCYSQRAVSREFLAGMYSRAYYVFRQSFVKTEVISVLRKAYLLTAVLLYEPEAEDFPGESALLEELGNLTTDKIRDTIGVKLGSYTPEELIRKFKQIIMDVNSIMDESAPEALKARARAAGVNKDDLNCVRFILFLELASNFLRTGDLSSAMQLLEKAEGLAKSGEMFTQLNDDVRKVSTAACVNVINRKSGLLANHQMYMTECLKLLKDSLKQGNLRAIYYPTQTYLIGNLYYRLEAGNYRPAKIWLKMARQTAVIYGYLGLSGGVSNGFLNLVDRILAVDVIKAAGDYTDRDLIDIDYLFVLRMKIAELEEAQVGIRAKPQECKDFLSFLWRVLARYNATTGTFPSTLETLVRMELISEKAANDFRCPVTGKKYGFILPSLIHPYTVAPLVFDEFVHDDDSGILGYMLFTDGTIADILSRQSPPQIGPMPE